MVVGGWWLVKKLKINHRINAVINAVVIILL